jgi:hypothetical protein
LQKALTIEASTTSLMPKYYTRDHLTILSKICDPTNMKLTQQEKDWLAILITA